MTLGRYSRYSIPDCGLIIIVGARCVVPLRVDVLFVAQAEALGNRQITLVVYFTQVGQHSATMTHELEQTTPTGLILLICTKMIGQLLDAARHNGDLHFRRTCICIMTMIIRDELGFNFFL